MTTKRTTIQQVHEFHSAFGVPLNNLAKPGLISEERAKLRINMIAEEFLELCDALGFRVTIQNRLYPMEGISSAGHKIKITPIDTAEAGAEKFLPNLGAIADALGDLDYVVAGTADEHGIPHDEIVAEIHRSNMSKLGEDGKPILREDGKVLKGPNYTPPNLWPILMRKQPKFTPMYSAEDQDRGCEVGHCDLNALVGSRYCIEHQG